MRRAGTVEPDERTLPIASPAETRAAITALLRQHRLRLVASLGVVLLASATELATPAVLGVIVDLTLERAGQAATTGWILVLLVVILLQAALTVIGHYLIRMTGETALAGLRERVMAAALATPSRRLERAGTGDLVSRVAGDVRVVGDAIARILPGLTGSMFTISLTVIGLGAIDWRFAVAVLIAVPVQVWATRRYVAVSQPIYRGLMRTEAVRAEQMLTSIDGLETVTAFGHGAERSAGISRASGAAAEAGIAAMREGKRFWGRLNLAELIGMTAVLLTGYWLVQDGAVSVGAATAAALFFQRLFDPIGQLLSGLDDVQRAGVGMSRLVGVLSLGGAPDAEPLRAAEEPGWAVAVESVGFGYDQDRPVVHDVTFAVRPGEKVALVGASGAGKTTVAGLVAGLNEAGSGSVRLVSPTGAQRLGGADAVGLLTQEVHVFAGPLGEDLRLARPDADDAALLAALATVGAGWVEELPHGLATAVGEGGHPLTGAQAQQLALARLVLRDPPVAVLDEADAEAGSSRARELETAAAAALAGRTALVVAHRLSQAARADRVLLMERGRLIEEGTHDELLAAGARYARLWAAWSSR